MLQAAKRAEPATDTMPAGGKLGNASRLFPKLVSAFREFVAPRYRPELHYMRGPGPAYARRAIMVEARHVVPRLRGETFSPR
jgi:hypothetical protein